MATGLAQHIHANSRLPTPRPQVRRRYFLSTAFGLSRALHHIQAQQAAEGGGAAPVQHDASGREVRIGRLQRQKVRVSRASILESAVKVMELYAKGRAMLELEYFDEVRQGAQEKAQGGTKRSDLACIELDLD